MSERQPGRLKVIFLLQNRYSAAEVWDWGMLYYLFQALITLALLYNIQV